MLPFFHPPHPVRLPPSRVQRVHPRWRPRPPLTSVSPLPSPSVGLLLARQMPVPLQLLGPVRRGNPAYLLCHLSLILRPRTALLLRRLSHVLLCRLGRLRKPSSRFMQLRSLPALADSLHPYVLLA